MSDLLGNNIVEKLKPKIFFSVHNFIIILNY